jgi:hypothetical protein
MAECRLHLHLKTAPDRRDSSVLRRETGRKAIVFSLACLLAWGATTFQAQSQGTAPATLSASEVERSFIEHDRDYRQRALTLPAELVAKSYFSEALSIKTLPRVKAGSNVIMLIFGTAQRVTKENVDAYTKGLSGLLDIISQAIRQRGVRQVGGTFIMNVGSNCEGFNNGIASIAQSDFRIKLVSGWPAMFEKLARLGGLAQFEGIVIEDTIAIGLPGDWEDVFGLGKIEAGRTEINFGKCTVTLTPH